MRFNSQTGKAALCRRGGLNAVKYFKQRDYPNLKAALVVRLRNQNLRVIARLEKELAERRARL